MTEQTAPRKLYRDEATTGSVKCLACGGPITLKGFGGVEQVSCPYCGSTLAPEESGSLELLQRVQRQRRASALPLHARGQLEGAPWEILGIVWRECQVDGVTYPWQEFLLFNPFRGYRWLVYSMSDGHWSVGGPLDGAPRVAGGTFSHRTVEFDQETYKHFQSVSAHVTYVEGEFPWQIKAGDQATAHEYVRPPHSISVEESRTVAGSDVAFTSLRYITPKEVWAAFGQKGSPPSARGVGSIQPNPHVKTSRTLWLSCAGFLAVWIVLTVLYIGSRDSTVVVSEHAVPLESYRQEIEIGEPGKVTTVDFTFTASPLSNSWAFADVMLVSLDREEAVGLSVEVDEWHGVSGGESWREGDPRKTVTVSNVQGGRYVLQVVPQTQPARRASGPAPGMTMSFALESDVVLGRYVALPFILIILFPFLNEIRRLAFDGRRWSNSDYAAEE